LIALPFYTVLCDLLIVSWWHVTSFNWLQIIVAVAGLMLTLIVFILLLMALGMLVGAVYHHFRKKEEHGLVVSWVKAKPDGVCPKLEFEHQKVQADKVIQI
jgi:hypothetical protein